MHSLIIMIRRWEFSLKQLSTFSYVISFWKIDSTVDQVRNGSGVRDFDQSKLYTLQELIEQFDVQLIGRRNFQVR